MYKVPFPNEYVVEVGKRRVILRYKGQYFLMCIFVSLNDKATEQNKRPQENLMIHCPLFLIL